MNVMGKGKKWKGVMREKLKNEKGKKRDQERVRDA